MVLLDKMSPKWHLLRQLHPILTENVKELNLHHFASHLTDKFPLGPFSFEGF